MANILLIGKYSIIEPLGLMFLAGALKSEGHNIKVFLFKESNGSDIIGGTFGRHYDFVGFSTYTGIHKIIYRKANILREFSKVIIGGPHAMAFMDECKAHADYVVPGEGIVSVKNICRGLVKPGIIFTPYLVRADYLPMPYREFIYDSYPELKNNPIKNVITTMGCDFSCSYCYNSTYRKLYTQFKVRQRPVCDIVKECIGLKDYPLELIFFQDDCFGVNLDWLQKFSEDYKKYVNVPFHCQIRPEVITDDRLKLLRDAGCHGITMAIETYNDDVRYNLLGRHGSLDQIRKAGHQIKSYGLKLRTEQMLALPNTTIEDELNLLKLNVGLQPDIAWSSIFAPYLGTKLGDWCKSNGWYNGTNDDLSDTFFSDTCLSFSKERAKQSNILNRIFSTCAKLPDGNMLAEKFIGGGEFTFDNWFKDTRQHFYNRCLYKVND